MELQLTTCPNCGSAATLLQTREEFEEFHDLAEPAHMVRIPVKVEEFRCQDPSCEFEFEKFIREPDKGES
jgi:hypothetical protein